MVKPTNLTLGGLSLFPPRAILIASRSLHSRSSLFLTLFSLLVLIFTMCALLPVVAFLLPLLLCSAAVSAHNITEILEGFPEYSLFNSYLTQTKLADEINSRQTITVLALDNGTMSALTAKKPLSVIKNELAIHVVLDYFDPQKLHQIPKGSTLSTTLYQTTGNAPGNTGFVNITDLQGGRLASAPPPPAQSSIRRTQSR